MDKPSSNTIVTAHATTDHLPQINEIYNHYIHNSTATFHLETESLAESTQIWESITDHQGLPYIVALDNPTTNHVLGYAYAKQYHPRPAYAATVEISVYLSPGVTGRGIGRTLLRELMHLLKESAPDPRRPHGVREVISVMADDPQHPMNLGAFYASEGFEKIGTMKRAGWKFERWIDVAYWQKSIGHG